MFDLLRCHMEPNSNILLEQRIPQNKPNNMPFQIVVLNIVIIVMFPTLVSALFVLASHGFKLLTQRLCCQRLLRNYFPRYAERLYNRNANTNTHSLDVAVNAGCEDLTPEERRKIFEAVLQERKFQIDSDTEKSSHVSYLESFHSISTERDMEQDNTLVPSSISEDECRKDSMHLEVDTISCMSHASNSEPQDEEKGEALFSDSLGDGREEDACVICLNEYQTDDKVLYATHCAHHFHKECLLLWLEKHDYCPFCRENMITPDEMKQAHNQVCCNSAMQEEESSENQICQTNLRKLGTSISRFLGRND